MDPGVVVMFQMVPFTMTHTVPLENKGQDIHVIYVCPSGKKGLKTETRKRVKKKEINYLCHKVTTSIHIEQVLFNCRA